jgi:hypothetical protein
MPLHKRNLMKLTGPLGKDEFHLSDKSLGHCGMMMLVLYAETPSLTACHDGREMSSFHQLWDSVCQHEWE